jgi:hypothetical protein
VVRQFSPDCYDCIDCKQFEAYLLSANDFKKTANEK